MPEMSDASDLRQVWRALLARAGVGLPDDDAVAAWDEACRLAAAARRIRERVEGGR